LIFIFQPDDSRYTISEMRDFGDFETYDIRKRCFALFKAGIYDSYYIGILEPWEGRMQIDRTLFYYDHWFDRHRYEWSLDDDINAQWMRSVKWILYEWRVKYGSSQIVYGRSRNLKLY